MSLWFHWRAAMQLLKRRKGPVIRMVAVAMIGALWSVVGGSWFLATWRDIDRQASEVRIDFMVRSEADDAAVREAVQDIGELPAVDHARYVRENEVWREFSDEVGADDDLRAVVTLPRFIRVVPLVDACTTNQLTLMTSSLLSRYQEVVHNATWPREYVRVLDARRRDVVVLAIIATALSLVMFVLAVAYAFRAEIHAAGGDLRVGMLLGASRLWTAMPHLLISMIAGAIGVVLSAGIIAAVANVTLEHVPWLARVQAHEVALILVGLSGLGILASLWQSARWRA